MTNETTQSKWRLRYLENRIRALSLGGGLLTGKANSCEPVDCLAELLRLRKAHRRDEDRLARSLGLTSIIRPGDRVLIHTPQRVGTKSVSKSVRLQIPDVNVLDSHYVSQEMEFAFRHNNYFGLPSSQQERKLSNLIKAREFVADVYGEVEREGMLYVVSLIRNPIEMVSSLFFLLYAHWREAVEKGDDLDMKALIESSSVADVFRATRESITAYFERWLSRELLVPFGLDWSDLDLSDGAGWKTVETDRFNLLFIKFERLGDFPAATATFFGQSLMLLDKNITANKKDADLISRMRSEIVFDKSYVDELFERIQLWRIYSKSEIESFFRQ